MYGMRYFWASRTSHWQQAALHAGMMAFFSLIETFDMFLQVVSVLVTQITPTPSVEPGRLLNARSYLCRDFDLASAGLPDGLQDQQP